jgi:hypothetical protein
LEDRLREMVCGGSLDLATAQQEIAVNWIAAYKKYFRTDKLLAEHFDKGAPGNFPDCSSRGFQRIGPEAPTGVPLLVAAGLQWRCRRFRRARS